QMKQVLSVFAWRPLTLILVVVSLPGCSKKPGEEQPTGETVRGTVKHRGKIVRFGSVQFYGEKGVLGQGLIDQSGQYEAKNLPAGPVQIVVATERKQIDSPMMVGRPQAGDKDNMPPPPPGQPGMPGQQGMGGGPGMAPGPAGGNPPGVNAPEGDGPPRPGPGMLPPNIDIMKELKITAEEEKALEEI